MVTALLFCGFAVVLTSCSSNDDPVNKGGEKSQTSWAEKWNGRQAKYTLMFYGCGGTNVDMMLETALSYMYKELNIDKPQVRLTVMYSMSKDFSQFTKEEVNSFYGKPATTYRYELSPDITFNKESYQQLKYKDASEVQLYSAQTLADFITWSKQVAPAENYILIPTNHGGGFDIDHEGLTRAIGYDDNQGLKPISQATIVQALKQTNTHLKALYWYGCLMGQMEVLTEVADLCDYQFCSSHVSVADYTIHPSHLIRVLNASPDNFEQACAEHGKLMEVDYPKPFVTNINAKGKAEPLNADWGCWRSNKLAAINQQIKLLGEKIKADMGDGSKAEDISEAIQGTYLFDYYTPAVDVVDFAYQLAACTEDAEYADIAEDLLEAIDAANVYHVSVIVRKYINDVLVQPYIKRFTTGVCIYGPKDPAQQAAKEVQKWVGYNASYKATLFDKATGWSQWMENNSTAVTRMNRNPCNDSSMSLFWLED